MKRKVLNLCLIFFIVPVFTFASAQNDTYTTLLRKLIVLLTKEIHLLETELAVRHVNTDSSVKTEATASLRIPSIDDLVPSQFYRGTYVALYATNGNTLIPIADTKIETTHQKLWDRFVQLVGVEYARAHIQELRIYSSRNAEYDAFTERDTNTGDWIVGLNVYGLHFERPLVWRELDQLFLHEIGHIVVDDNPKLYEAFSTTFWNDRDKAHAERVTALESGPLRDDIVHEYYVTHPEDFVSEYAATSPLEDVAESFVYFILDQGHTGAQELDRKVNSFYAYPELVKMRARIRALI